MSTLANVSAIRQEAEKLREAAEKLEEAASILESRFGGNGSLEPATKVPRKKARRRKAGRRKKVTRRMQMLRTLREHGPLRRHQIVEKGGIPLGSVSTYLRDEHGFKKLPDGRWTVADYNKEKDK